MPATRCCASASRVVERVLFDDDAVVEPRAAIKTTARDADGVLEIVDGSEHAAFEAAISELGEEAFDGIEPGGRGWREVEGPTRMLREPFAYLRMLVSG